MRILITGGAGFIGTAVIRHCLQHTEYSVVNVDKLTYAANLANFNSVLPNPRYVFEHVDICDAAAVRRVFETHDPDGVMHLAAETHVDRSIDGPSLFVQTNIVGTSVLLEESRRHYQALSAERRKAFRFHQISTDEVYGSLGPEGLFTEVTPYAPNSPYSASKAGSDMLVRAWYHTFGLPVVTSHCSNNYGPYQFPEKLIPVVIIAALEGRPIPVYGEGKNIRDWLFVDDHARALLTVFERGVPGETYNIGGHAELRNIDLVRMICRTFDALRPDMSDVSRETLIHFVTDRPGHDLRYAINTSKIERELGWKPQMTFEQGLRETVLWYLDNQDWWKTIRQRGFEDGRLGLVKTP